ncbi:uncharacterized protein LOC144330461 [Macaca mulatta]
MPSLQGPLMMITAYGASHDPISHHPHPAGDPRPSPVSGFPAVMKQLTTHSRDEHCEDVFPLQQRELGSGRPQLGSPPAARGSWAQDGLSWALPLQPEGAGLRTASAGLSPCSQRELGSGRPQLGSPPAARGSWAQDGLSWAFPCGQRELGSGRPQLGFPLQPEGAGLRTASADRGAALSPGDAWRTFGPISSTSPGASVSTACTNFPLGCMPDRGRASLQASEQEHHGPLSPSGQRWPLLCLGSFCFNQLWTPSPSPGPTGPFFSGLGQSRYSTPSSPTQSLPGTTYEAMLRPRALHIPTRPWSREGWESGPAPHGHDWSSHNHQPCSLHSHVPPHPTPATFQDHPKENSPDQPARWTFPALRSARSPDMLHPPAE